MHIGDGITDARVHYLNPFSAHERLLFLNRKHFCQAAVRHERRTRTSCDGRSTCRNGTRRFAATGRARRSRRTSRGSSSRSRSCSTRASTRTRCSRAPRSKSCVPRTWGVHMRADTSTCSLHAASTLCALSHTSTCAARSGATASVCTSTRVSGRPLSSAIPASLVRISSSHITSILSFLKNI